MGNAGRSNRLTFHFVIWPRAKAGLGLPEVRPNLLVKAISEHAKVPTLSFFGYAVKFAIPVFLTIFVLISLLFSLRGNT